MRRPLPLATAFSGLACVALVVTGCASGPSGAPAARGDVAATVGDVTVPVSLVQDRVRTSVPDLRAAIEAQAAQAGQGGGAGRLDAETLAARSRTLLTQSILHELIATQSRAEGVVVTAADVDARLGRAGGAEAVAAGSGYDAATVRELVSDQVAVAEIGRREFDTLTVTVDYASVPDRSTADALAARVVADPGGPALSTQPPTTSFTDTVLRPGTDQGGSGQVAATSVLFGLPADSVSVTSAAPQGATGADQPDPTTQPWSVVHVRRRAFDAGPPGPGVVPAALVDDQTMIEFGLRTLQPVAGRVGVAVNPRFGTWDPTQLRVVAPPSAAGVVTPVAPVPATGPTQVAVPPAPASTLPAPAP